MKSYEMSEDKVIRRFRLDVPWPQFSLREVFQVGRDDALGAALDSRGEFVPVIRVGMLQRLDERLLASCNMSAKYPATAGSATPEANVLALGTYGLVKHRSSGTALDPELETLG